MAIFAGVFAGIFALLELLVYGQVKLWPDGLEPSRVDITGNSAREKQPQVKQLRGNEQPPQNHSRFLRRFSSRHRSRSSPRSDSNKPTST
jgi:hypothetical protein